ncbi:hypothetical protein ACFQ9Z_38975 [Streptomyces sp. NPDC056580]|uniref:hypothetical protein n=1 Tax=Streptomyces sp. NPDC056580 TaxID=3345872 RepID=UPI0036CD6DCE
MTLRRFFALAVVGTAAASIAVPGTASAAASVSRTMTSCNGAQLQQAVAQVNSAPGGGSVKLKRGCTYKLTQADPVGTPNGFVQITNSSGVTILGNGATIKRDSASKFRFFEVLSGGVLTLDHVTLTNGHAASPANAAVGGAVWLHGGQVTISRSYLKRNTADLEGGALDNDSSLMTVADSTVEGNSVVHPATSPFGAFGGGLASAAGAITVFDNSSITKNTVVSQGADLSAGGGIEVDSSTVRLNHSLVSHNRVTGPDARGGGIVSQNGSLAMLDHTKVLDNKVTGSVAARGGGIYNDSTLTLTDSPVGADSHGNSVKSDGGPAQGGGIFNGGSGTTTLMRSPVQFNRASGMPGDGGGIFNSAATGNVTLANSPVRKNKPNNCVNVNGC